VTRVLAFAMRILFLTCHLPFPPVSGGRLREYELLRRVTKNAEVTLCAVSKTYAEDREAAAELAKSCTRVAVFPAEPSPSANATLARYCSPAATAYVSESIASGEVDAVHVEGFYLAHHVSPAERVPLLLVEQNVEYALWRQRGRGARQTGERIRALRTYRVIRQLERAAWRRSSMIGTVTHEDRAAIVDTTRGLDVRVVPDGADHLQAPEANTSPDPRTVVMVANYAYSPNDDAARWFCDEIVPRLRRRVPDAKVVLVGNEPSFEIRSRACDALVVTGQVPRIEPYLDQAAVVVCPLRIGGGIKVKMLEALSRSKAVVTTSVGTQGFGEAIHDAVAVAETAPEFAAAIARLLEQPAERLRLEAAARAFADKLPTWDDAAGALLDCYSDLAAAARRRPERRRFLALPGQLGRSLRVAQPPSVRARPASPETPFR
jgi:glycosyltransferase involved in cell wall biosynthesis